MKLIRRLFETRYTFVLRSVEGYSAIFEDHLKDVLLFFKAI